MWFLDRPTQGILGALFLLALVYSGSGRAGPSSSTSPAGKVVDGQAPWQVCDATSCTGYADAQHAAQALRDGDSLKVARGDYIIKDVVIRANNVTITATDAHFTPPKDGVAKGLWVIFGQNVTMIGGECSGVKSPYRNGACVKVEGGSFTAQGVNWHDSEDGLLAGRRCGVIRLINVNIHNNGAGGGGKSHNIYVSDCYALVVQNSQIVCNIEGHGIKSGARITQISGTTIDSRNCPGSREVDIYCGGRVEIFATRITKGAASPHQDMLAIGMEPGRCDRAANGTSIPFRGSTVRLTGVVFASGRKNTVPIHSVVPITFQGVSYRGTANARANHIQGRR